MAMSREATAAATKPQPLPPVRAKRIPEPTPTPALAPDPAPAEVAQDVLAEYPPDFVRKPFGGQVQKLRYPERPGFHRHWFNDIPGRISKAQEAGYKHVTDRDGKNVARIVGVAATGGGQNAFLMEIPEQWWKDDQAIKDKARDELDAKMRRGIVKDHTPGHDGAYLPTNQAGTVGPDIKVHGR